MLDHNDAAAGRVIACVRSAVRKGPPPPGRGHFLPRFVARARADGDCTGDGRARSALITPARSRLQVLRFSSPGTRRRYIIIRHSPAPQPIPTCRCSAFATLRCRVLARTMSMAASQYGGDSLARGLRAPIACRMFTRPSCPTLQMHRRPSRPRSDRRRSAWRPAASGRPP
jgi:hypothetical protein